MSAFVATADLSVRNHMEVQAICQKHIDNSISKTINIPKDYDIGDYGDLMLEFRATVERNNCLSSRVKRE